MSKAVLVVGFLILGCATHSSTVLVDDAGNTYTCAAHGEGWIAGIFVDGFYEDCVQRAKRLGYVEVPKGDVELRIAMIGVRIAPNSTRVDRVTEGSGADEAGIEVDDIILEIDGNSVAGVTDIFVELADKRRGDTVTVSVDRSWKIIHLPVALGRPCGE